MPRFWRQCRIAFRCVRFAAWLTVLAVLAAALWCNRVGVPDFLKARLVATLAERGVKLEFSRMRLSLVHGFIAENVRAGQTQTSASPALTARSVQLQLNFPALLHQRWQLDGLVLRDGEFTLPLSPTNALMLTNLQTALRFLPGDTWALDHFRADLAGAQIGISGEIAHAPAVLNWKFFDSHGTNSDAFMAAMQQFSGALRQIHFQGEPQLRLTLAGDARDPHSITIWLRATAAGVNTPWFAAHDFLADATLTAPASAPTNTAANSGFWTNLQPFRLVWSARLGTLHAQPLDAAAVRCAGIWAAPTLAITNLAAQLDGGNLTATATLDVTTRTVAFASASQFDWHAIAKLLPENLHAPLTKISWPQPPALRVTGNLRLPAWTNSATGQAKRAPELTLRGDVAFTNALIGHLKLDEVRTHFAYDDLLWDVPDLTVVQGRTRLLLSGEESEATKNFRCRVTGQLDAASVSALLPSAEAVHGLAVLTCHEPLTLAMDLDGNLRALEKLCATGRIALTNFAIRGEAFDSVASTFLYSNLVATIHAPEIWRANHTQWLKADTLWLDFRRMGIWITNGLVLTEPQSFARCIGPKTAHMLEPYQFLAPPLARVNGSAPIMNVQNGNDLKNTDLTIEIIRGVPFRWAKLATTNITGIIHWKQQSLTLTNLVAKLYDGDGTGHGYLDFRPLDHDSDFNFGFAITNIDLHLLAADLSTNKNTLAGRLSGAVAVTNASSATWRSWNGYGHAELHNGLLWDVPIFAFVSPLLNHVSPGLGNNRASQAATPFLITNGVIVTDALLIRTEMMRLQYSGTVDLEQNVNARVTAQLLRNLPVVGSLVSAVLMPVGKVFECHVTGQLGEPVVTPVYIPNFIPKMLMVPLHPIRSLEELFSPPSTNAPAVEK